MTELVLHNGMNKCASTTLQQDVFKHEPGYLGKFIGLDISLDFGKQFQRLAPVGGRQIADIKGVENWVEKVNKDAIEYNPSVSRFIISSESLCQSNKLSTRPIIPFLQTINKEVFGHERIKVIIVFRNQADMLASSYAQNSGVQYKSSQIDFENWVENRMNGACNTQLDWGGWAQDLIHSFGKEHVCIILLEEIQLISFWNKLINFIDAKKLNADELHKKNYIHKKE